MPFAQSHFFLSDCYEQFMSCMRPWLIMFFLFYSTKLRKKHEWEKQYEIYYIIKLIEIALKPYQRKVQVIIQNSKRHECILQQEINSNAMSMKSTNNNQKHKMELLLKKKERKYTNHPILHKISISFYHPDLHSFWNLNEWDKNH